MDTHIELTENKRMSDQILLSWIEEHRGLYADNKKLYEELRKENLELSKELQKGMAANQKCLYEIKSTVDSTKLGMLNCQANREFCLGKFNDFEIRLRKHTQQLADTPKQKSAAEIKAEIETVIEASPTADKVKKSVGMALFASFAVPIVISIILTIIVMYAGK